MPLCAPSARSGDYSYELVVPSGSAIIINKEWAYFLLFARTLISVQSPLSGLVLLGQCFALWQCEMVVGLYKGVS